MSSFMDKLKGKFRGLYAEAYEELATLEGVDAMDPTEPDGEEHADPDRSR